MKWGHGTKFDVSRQSAESCHDEQVSFLGLNLEPLLVGGVGCGGGGWSIIYIIYIYIYENIFSNYAALIILCSLFRLYWPLLLLDISKSESILGAEQRIFFPQKSEMTMEVSGLTRNFFWKIIPK